jgi:chromosomal replication initiator protein
VSAELDHVWPQIQAELAETVDEPVYRIWLEPLRAIDLADGHLTLEASPQSCAWVRDRFGRVIQACAAAVLGPDLTVDVVERGREDDRRSRPGHSRPAAPSTHASRHIKRANHEHGFQKRASEQPVNPKLTFEQFVIGDSNRLAHAAALAVSEMPAQAYNPLFICGPPGLGKTHLLNSIANLIGVYNPRLEVRRTTGEAFTNDFLLALGSGGLDRFKAAFRHVDVLLIDDVQFLERKTKTEEEFFHTFDVLYEAGSQIVLTSDRPPNDLQALEDRLRERFAAGLVADIRPPDLPTRVAILRKRADHDGLDVADSSALQVIAERVSVNVRALEGALIRVVAFSSLTGRPLTAELAREVLDGLYPRAKRPIRSIDDIKAAACEQFGVSSEELVSSSRTPRVTWPRQVAMYLARELTGESLPAIGRAFGGRDHTTVLHAWRRTEQRMSASSDLRAVVDELRARLSTGSC